MIFRAHIAQGREYEHGNVELDSVPAPGATIYVQLDFGPQVVAQVDAVDTSHRIAGFDGSLDCHG